MGFGAISLAAAKHKWEKSHKLLVFNDEQFSYSHFNWTTLPWELWQIDRGLNSSLGSVIAADDCECNQKHALPHLCIKISQVGM